MAVLLLTATGCSQLSVRHLQRQPWLLDADQSVELEFWRFEYAISPGDDAFVVKGKAFPVMENYPEWAGWIQELWLASYLSNAEGRVLAKDIEIYPSRELAAGAGVEFLFNLEPQELLDGELFITFGYRITCLESRDAAKTTAPGEQPEVFFASETALTLF